MKKLPAKFKHLTLCVCTKGDKYGWMVKVPTKCPGEYFFRVSARILTILTKNPCEKKTPYREFVLFINH